MSPSPTGENWELRHGGQRAVVVQLGAVLRHYEVKLLRQSVERAFTDPARRAVAGWADSQGIGGRSRPHR